MRRRVAERDADAVDDALDTVAGDGRKSVTSAGADVVAVGVGDDRLGQRVLATAFERRRDPQHRGGIALRERLTVGNHRPAVGESAGLVEDDRLDPVGRLERITALDEDAVLGPLAGTDHDGRRASPGRARTGRR